QRRPALRPRRRAVRIDGSWDVAHPSLRRHAVLPPRVDHRHESRMRPVRGAPARRFILPDGSERYLVDERQLMEVTARLGGRLLDPLKTSVVQDQRCMTTWVVRKD